MLLYPDYESLVIQDYQNKRAENVLHSGLIDPSPARLKDACLAICNERFEARDERTLKEFFGQGRDKAACLTAIERLKTDKLKPLAIFLNNGTTSTNRKNIELLAWLIDFRPRPFIFNEIPDQCNTSAKSGAPLREQSIEDRETEASSGVEEKEKVSPDPLSVKDSARKTGIRIATLAILLMGLTSIGPDTGKPMNSTLRMVFTLSIRIEN